MTPVDFSKHDSLASVCRATDQLPMGGTDCAMPMLWALKQKVEADTFVIYTDSETWAGSVHPVQALGRYRRETGIPARLAVVGIVSNGFSIAAPDDPLMLDVVGFDSSAPSVLRSFSAGEF